MSDIEKILAHMQRSPHQVRVGDLQKVCEAYFAKPRQKGTNHAVYKTPWAGDPRVNIQNDRGKAKAY